MHYALVDEQTLVEGKSATHFHHIVRSVGTSAGLEKAAQIEIVFDPLFQTLVFHQLDLLRNGVRTNRLDTKRIQLIQRETRLEQRMVDGRVTAVILLQDLRVGDKVEYAYTVSGLNPVLGGKFAHQVYVGNSTASISQFQFRLLSPDSRVIYHSPAQAYQVSETTHDGRRETVFARSNVALMNVDQFAPGSAYLGELLQFSEFGSWSDVVTWGTELFGSASAAQGPVAQRGQALREAANTDLERARLALDFVQKEIRYFGTELGVNSHKPVAPEIVLQQRFGDCKDKTNLLIALLKELGISASPVLVNTSVRSETELLLPSPFAFNHVIARVEIQGNVYMLDATRNFQNGGIAQRQSNNLGQGLVLQVGTSALVNLPKVGSADQMTVEDVFRITDFTKDIELQSTATWYGEYAEYLRALLAEQPRDKIDQQFAADYVRVYGQALVSAPIRYEEVTGSNAIRVVQTFNLPDLWRFPEQQRLLGDFAFWSIAQSLNFPNEATRKQSYRVGMLGSYRHTIDIDFPQDVYRNSDTVKFDERNAVFQYHSEFAMSPHHVQLKAEVTLQQEIIAATQWTAHFDKISKLRQRFTVNLTVPAITFARAEQLKNESAELETRSRGDADMKGIGNAVQSLFGLGGGKPTRRKPVTPVQAKAQWRTLLMTAVLESNRLNPKLRAQALAERGAQWDNSGESDKGAADFAQAISLAPKEASYYAGAAVSAVALGQDAQASSFLSQALTLNPTEKDALRDRARLAYLTGDYPAAHKEYQSLATQAQNEEMLYTALWLYLSTSRVGENAVQAVRSAMPTGASHSWPYPVLQTFLGEIDADNAEHVAKEGEKDPSRLCELYFFTGERYLLNGDEKRARTYFQKAVDTEVVEFVEYTAAKRRLASLAK
jgi:lipoprotein NlpI